jgi:hypothetical protein
MSKAGNAHLQAAWAHMADIGLADNPIIGAHYARKRAPDVSPMNALGHCMCKALFVVWGVWGVWRSGREFDQSMEL